MRQTASSNAALVGVGLRQPHYHEALNSKSAIDFVEVHAENFFAQGGASIAVLQEISERYPLSLHSTALGLGSTTGVPLAHVESLSRLCQLTAPILVSDHLCFGWAQLGNKTIHAGDLLPIVYNEENLDVLCQNIDFVQQHLGREILVENLSAYISYENSVIDEWSFLAELHRRCGCKLLLDLNNILVTAANTDAPNPMLYAQNFVDALPIDSIGEIHLAGYKPVSSGQLVIDDHSHPVSEITWDLFRYTLQRFGNIPTLIEWDNDLPSWEVLIGEAAKAKAIATSVLPENI